MAALEAGCAAPLGALADLRGATCWHCGRRVISVGRHPESAGGARLTGPVQPPRSTWRVELRGPLLADGAAVADVGCHRQE